jgi:two-component system sensor histidine kinase RegB
MPGEPVTHLLASATDEPSRAAAVRACLAAAAGSRAVPDRAAAVLDAALARLAPADRGRVVVDAPADAAVVWPVAAMSLALGNVVRNALQASAPDGLVTIRVRPADGARLTIETADRGRGMTADELARAGDPFFTTKAPGDGIGLGLFVTRSTVEQLDGTMAIRSRPGEGTIVTIALPADVLARPA